MCYVCNYYFKMNTTLDLYKRNKSCQLRKFGEQIARVGNVDNLPLYELARRDIRYNATSRWSENPSRGRGKPPATFSSSDIYHLNASSRPSIHRRPSIRFKHDKYNPPRALVHGLCLLTVVALCNGFRRISSDVQQNRAYVADPITSLFISILITWTLATQCPKNIEGEVCGGWWCVAG